MVDSNGQKTMERRRPETKNSNNIFSKKAHRQPLKQDPPVKPSTSKNKKTGQQGKRAKRKLEQFRKYGKLKTKGSATQTKEQKKDSIETIDVDSNWAAFLKERMNGKSTKRKKEESESHDETRNKKKSKTETSEDKKSKNKSKSKGKRKKQTNDDSQNEEPDKKSDNKEVWFDDVDEIHIEKKSSIQTGIHKGLTHTLAIDCEMVGVGKNGLRSILARVSVVNQYGHCVYDKFVKPTEKITDYRTWVSGVTPELLKTAEEFKVVIKEVGEIFAGRIIVGHSVANDLKALQLNHPSTDIRDTQQFPPYIALNNGRKPGLKMLCKKILGMDIQSAEHSSVEDAQATMRLYTLVKHQWESKMLAKGGPTTTSSKNSSEKLTFKKTKKSVDTKIVFPD